MYASHRAAAAAAATLTAAAGLAAAPAAAAPADPAPTAAAAAPAIQVSRIHYDPPGPDRLTNTQLNAEYIQLRSNRALRTNLYRWFVQDAAGNRYVFTGTFYLYPGRTVTIRTGTGTDTATTRYWGRGNYVWNNTGREVARLYNPLRALVDVCVYTGSAGGVAAC